MGEGGEGEGRREALRNVAELTKNVIGDLSTHHELSPLEVKVIEELVRTLTEERNVAIQDKWQLLDKMEHMRAGESDLFKRQDELGKRMEAMRVEAADAKDALRLEVAEAKAQAERDRAEALVLENQVSFLEARVGHAQDRVDGAYRNAVLMAKLVKGVKKINSIFMASVFARWGRFVDMMKKEAAEIKENYFLEWAEVAGREARTKKDESAEQAAQYQAREEKRRLEAARRKIMAVAQKMYDIDPTSVPQPLAKRASFNAWARVAYSASQQKKKMVFILLRLKNRSLGNTLRRWRAAVCYMQWRENQAVKGRRVLLRRLLRLGFAAWQEFIMERRKLEALRHKAIIRWKLRLVKAAFDQWFEVSAHLIAARQVEAEYWDARLMWLVEEAKWQQALMEPVLKMLEPRFFDEGSESAQVITMGYKGAQAGGHAMTVEAKKTARDVQRVRKKLDLSDVGSGTSTDMWNRRGAENILARVREAEHAGAELLRREFQRVHVQLTWQQDQLIQHLGGAKSDEIRKQFWAGWAGIRRGAFSLTLQADDGEVIKALVDKMDEGRAQLLREKTHNLMLHKWPDRLTEEQAQPSAVRPGPSGSQTPRRPGEMPAWVKNQGQYLDRLQAAEPSPRKFPAVADAREVSKAMQRQHAAAGARPDLDDGSLLSATGAPPRDPPPHEGPRASARRRGRSGRKYRKAGGGAGQMGQQTWTYPLPTTGGVVPMDAPSRTPRPKPGLQLPLIGGRPPAREEAQGGGGRAAEEAKEGGGEGGGGGIPLKGGVQLPPVEASPSRPG